MNTLRCFIKAVLESHCFFVTESRWYIGKYVWHDRGTRYECAVHVYSYRYELWVLIRGFKSQRSD